MLLNFFFFFLEQSGYQKGRAKGRRRRAEEAGETDCGAQGGVQRGGGEAAGGRGEEQRGAEDTGAQDQSSHYGPGLVERIQHPKTPEKQSEEEEGQKGQREEEVRT